MPIRLLAPVRTGSRKDRSIEIGPPGWPIPARMPSIQSRIAGGMSSRAYSSLSLLDLLVEVGGQRGEVGDEPQELVDQRRDRQPEELADDDDRPHVDDQDRDRTPEAVAGQPAHWRIEQVHEQQADDERPDAVLGDQQQDSRGTRRRR